MKKLLFIGFASLLVACSSNSDLIDVRNKTTIEIDPVFDGGTVIKGEKIDASFTMTNTGDYPLVVAEVKGSCTCTVVAKPEEPIAPGDSYVIKAMVDTEKTGVGAITKGITIVANTEPANTQVTVKGIVKIK